MFLQWQAGSRQQSIPSGFQPDKSSWGWNWLERWMAVRPWENRFLDINLRDGVMVKEDGSTETEVKNDSKSQIKPAEVKNDSKSQIKSADVKNESRSQTKSVGKKPVPLSQQSNMASQKTGPSHSDGSTSSPVISAGNVETSTTQLARPKPKLPLEDLTEEANSRPAGVGPRSRSNPKERTSQSDKPVKKRLSLPNSGESSFSLTFIWSRRISFLLIVESKKLCCYSFSSIVN